MSFDLRTRKSSVSANLHRLLELDEHDTSGSEDLLAPLQSPETQLLVRLRLEEAIAAGTGWDFEVPLVTGSGRTIWARLRGVVEFDNGVATALRGVLQDVTERTRLEADLLQAAKTESIGRLAGGVAHDFNNMLTVILAGAEIALGELHPTDPSRVHLEQIRSAAQRSADLTRQLLAFARQQTVEPSVIDPDNTVTAMTSMLHASLVKTSSSPGAPTRTCGRSGSTHHSSIRSSPTWWSTPATPSRPAPPPSPPPPPPE